MSVEIVSTVERPDLVPVIARWLWKEFGEYEGRSYGSTRAEVAETLAADGMPASFILLLDGEPVGTASLTRQDLDQRPDLTPWLAGVFVLPHARNQGHASRLVQRVEHAAAETGIETLWLYTRTAESLYARLGWQRAETFTRHDLPHVLMRRNLAGA